MFTLKNSHLFITVNKLGSVKTCSCSNNKFVIYMHRECRECTRTAKERDCALHTRKSTQSQDTGSEKEQLKMNVH